MNNRWYDRHKSALETLEILKTLDNKAKSKLSNDIIEIANQIKDMRNEEEEPPLSIGIDRVLGLYQTSNSRRWYDKNMDLCNAMRVLSALPEEDFLNIMEGLSVSLTY